MPDTVFLPDRIEVTRPIAAPPSAIFDIVRSPAGHVAIDASGMLQDYTGEAAEVKSFFTTTPVHRMETEDLAVAAVRFKSGALGVVHATTTAFPGFPERIELIGTEGTALLEGTSLQMKFQDGRCFEMKTESGGGGTGADPMAFPHDWHRSLLEDFLDAIEKNREPRISGAEGLKVHRFIDRILQSAG